MAPLFTLGRSARIVPKNRYVYKFALFMLTKIFSRRGKSFTMSYFVPSLLSGRGVEGSRGGKEEWKGAQPVALSSFTLHSPALPTTTLGLIMLSWTSS